MEYTVGVRNAELEPIGQVDSYTRLEATVRYCDVGAWLLEIPANATQARLLTPGRGIVISQPHTGRVLISGPVTSIERRRGTEQDTGAGTIVFSGKSDDLHAWNHLAFPRTTQPIATWTEQNRKPVCEQHGGNWTRRRVHAGRIVSDAIANNYSQAAPIPDRRTPHLGRVRPSSAGALTSASFRYTSLGSELKKICETSGIGYRHIYNPPKARIDTHIYSTRDLSGTVVFSHERANLAGYEYTLTAPATTRAVVAAQGQGPDRYVMQVIDTDAETAWGYVAETFIDRRDLPVKRGPDGAPVMTQKPADGDEFQTTSEVISAMVAEARAHLAENGPAASLALKPLDTEQQRFGRDWWLGDRVTVEADGTSFIDIVREVTFTHAADEQTVAPVIGTPGADSTPGLFKRVDRIWSSLERLHARY